MLACELALPPAPFGGSLVLDDSPVLDGSLVLGDSLVLDAVLEESAAGGRLL